MFSTGLHRENIKIVLAETSKSRYLIILGMQHHLMVLYQVCSNPLVKNPWSWMVITVHYDIKNACIDNVSGYPWCFAPPFQFICLIGTYLCLIGTFENGVDTDKMLHIAAFHQGPLCFLKETRSVTMNIFRKKKPFSF